MKNSVKNFRIPKAFTLFGHHYQVKYCDDLHERENCYGEADENKKMIRLQSKKVFDINEITNHLGEKTLEKQYYELSDERMVEIFLHEMVHIILDSMDEDQLSENEKFVNIFAKGLLQVYLYSEYD